MEWRFIPKTKLDPHFTIAMEEVLINKVSKSRTPMIRFWEWESKTITIGRSQKASNEVDLELCKELDISVIRRPSGGGTMYHAPGREIVYSVIAPRDYFPDDITEIYREICGVLVKTLRDMDIFAEFVKPNSVFIDDKKISGSAQKITKKAVLQHGTVLYEPDEEEMFSLLKRNDSPDKYISSKMSPVSGISRVKEISFSELYNALKEGFLDGKEYFTERLSDKEFKETEELVNKKYERESWNLNP